MDSQSSAETHMDEDGLPEKKRRKIVENECYVESVKTCNVNGEDEDFVKNLMRLPDEVLILILELLPPTTLLVLLGCDSWISRLVHCVKVVNCRECLFIPFQDFKMFISNVGHQIRELYLDNLVSMKSKEFCLLVSRCKNLKILSLKNCGVLVQHLYIVFERVKLEELFFTIINPSDTHPLRQMRWDNRLFIHQLKKLHLEVGDLTMFHYFVRYLIPFCYELVEIRLDFSINYRFTDFLSTRCADIVFGTEDPPTLPYLNSIIITWPMEKHLVMRSALFWKETHLPSFLEWLFYRRVGDIKWKKFWMSDSLNTVEILQRCKARPVGLSTATSLFINEGEAEEHSLSILKNCSPNSVRHLGIRMPKFTMDHVQCIDPACGNKLRQFSAISSDKSNILMAIQPFQQLLKTCNRITDLDISGVHVTDRNGVSFCLAIALLKDLKRLCVPVCAITDIPVHVSPNFLNKGTSLFAPVRARKRTCRHNLINQNATGIFSRMVMSCPLVENFHLTGCQRCGSSDVGSIFCENIISDIYLWKKLKHLTIDNVPSLRLFTFLDAIAEHCDDFLSLDISNVGHHEVFHFMTSLVKILKYSQKFTFLRIVHPMFHWSAACFWEAVASAKNLQGLCIASEVNEFVNGNVVIMSLMGLTKFHVFHLHCKSVLRNKLLYQRLKAMIAKKTGRGDSIENTNLIFENVQQNSLSGFVREPHCHMYHCGITNNTLKGPSFT